MRYAFLDILMCGHYGVFSADSNIASFLTVLLEVDLSGRLFQGWGDCPKRRITGILS